GIRALGLGEVFEAEAGLELDDFHGEGSLEAVLQCQAGRKVKVAATALGITSSAALTSPDRQPRHQQTGGIKVSTNASGAQPVSTYSSQPGCDDSARLANTMAGISSAANPT